MNYFRRSSDWLRAQSQTCAGSRIIREGVRDHNPAWPIVPPTTALNLNHLRARNPFTNHPADVLRKSGRVSLGSFAHTLRGTFGQRGAVVALLKLAESAGEEVTVKFIFHQ